MAKYDPDAIVQAVSALYATQMHMKDGTPLGNPVSRLVVPPQDWTPPFNTPKTAAVIDLAKRLPYYEGNFHLAPDTKPVSYYQPNWQGTWMPFEPFGQGEADISDTELALTMQDDNAGTILILDTRTGDARLIADTMSIADCARHTSHECPPLCRHSRLSSYAVRPAVELLGEWRNNLLSLKWLIGPSGALVDEGSTDEDRMDRMREIYRQHGWPGDYRAAECREAIENMPSDVESDDDE